MISNLINLANSSNASTQVRAIAFYKLEELRTWYAERLRISSDVEWKAHFLASSDRIKRFQERPEEFKVPSLLDPPPGQPIGDFEAVLCEDY